MKLAINMIVKDEASRIVRALDSISPYICWYAITDTGSTDGTPDVIRKYFEQKGIPGIINHAPFRDWSQARNAALAALRGSRHRWDYAILMDADMELVVKDFQKFRDFLKGGLSYDMEQRAGSLHYGNRRLVGRYATGQYVGVTHEFLNVDSAGMVPPEVAYFTDHADGSNRPEKFKRDISLLLAGLEKEPNNGRYFYYLAQSYRDAGDIESAKLWFKKRVDFGGWDEERWSAQVNYAHCFKETNEAEFIRNMLVAYNMRPSRAESLYDLAHHFRLKDDQQNIAALFAEIGMDIPRPKDLLFVNDFVYEAGLKEEFAIAGYYNEQKRPKAFSVCQKLSITPGPYPSARASARNNLYWYMPTLKESCPSFEWRPIPFTPPEGWVALNPSITAHGDKNNLWCTIRTVNYRLDADGRYLIRGTDGTCNAENPINTRNYLAYVGNDPFIDDVWPTKELTPAEPLPCEFPLVIGFEDMRLFSWKKRLWTSSTVRQIHWDGNCEQVLARIEHDKLVDVKRMLREPRETEKNWAPIADSDNLSFMWRPGVVVDTDGKIVCDAHEALSTDIISGGSQLIPYGSGCLLGLVHTAHTLPGSACRYYYHRFVVYAKDTFHVVGLSPPFVFNEKTIEFAAGLARHPTDTKLVISYGFKDAEARIATINETEVENLIWGTSKS